MKKILLALALLGFAFSTTASSIKGGEITFRQTAPLTLETTVYLYFKPAAAGTVPDSLALCWGDGSCSTALLTNGIDADNNGLPDGEQLTDNLLLGVYTQTHTYSAAEQYTLSVTLPNRVPNILNLPPSNPVLFHVESTATVTTSDSPQYSPVFYEYPMLDPANVNARFTHLPATFDQDGDEVVHSWSIPLNENGVPLPGIVEPTNINPGSNNVLNLDSATGLIIWDAPQQEGLYLVNLTVTTYRDGILWGQVTRDMLIEVEDLMALPPLLTLSDDAPVQEVLIGDEVDLEAVAESLPFGQEVELTAAGGLFEFFSTPAAFDTTAGAQPTEAFTWTVEPEDQRETPYILGFKAKDLSHGLATFVPVQFRVVDELTATETAGQPAVLRVFPNPATASARVGLQGIRFPVTYQLWSAGGQLLRQGQWVEGPARVDATALPAGHYQLQVLGAGGQQGVASFVK